MRKESSKLKYLFGHEGDVWSCSDEYLSFVTPCTLGDMIVRKTAEKYRDLSQCVIWDMFGGVGTDASRFARVAGKVICTEINPNTYGHLLANYKRFAWKNVECLQADCIFTMFNTPPRCDIVYFDPPWGETFKSGQPFNFEDVKLRENINIMELAMMVYERYGNIIVKVPYTCDSFERHFDADAIDSIYTCSQQRLKFIFIRRPI
jgi:16S rRNA G966 N2-methylase RsmD